MHKQLIIITINDPVNYGNRLQNYALSELLSEYGEVYTAQCEWSDDNNIRRMMLPLIRFMRKIKRAIREKWDGTLDINTQKRANCSNFTKEYVRDDIFSVTVRKGLLPNKPIDGVILGSDQIWNDRWVSKNTLALRLGSFVSSSVPVISYAASFGVTNVSDEAKLLFREYLPLIKAISVREDRGAELIKEMTGLEASVVLDPTLMLDVNQWNRIIRGFVPDDRYVLTYFLGKPSAEQEQVIQTFAAEHNCHIRRIFDLRDKKTYVAGPQDFVELFSKAQYVFTDSYHACCFSILYHKQFTVFNRAGMEGRANMNSRMETLFRLFDLDSVVMDNGLAPQIDYHKVDQLLDKHRAESQAWLDNAMAEN